MFDHTAFDNLRIAMRRASDQPVALATVAQKADALRTLAAVRDHLDGAIAQGLADLEASDGHLDEGAPSIAAWARQHLRLDVRTARTWAAAGRTLRELPAVAEASRAGAIRIEHVAVLTCAITRLGADTVRDAQDWLLPVAQTCDPSELRAVVRELHEVVDPERLERAYERGLDRRDVHLDRCADGYHLGGFLDLATGSRFRTWLEAASAPKDAEDERAPSERRTQALDSLVSSALAHGLPTDRGVRPQVHVEVELATLGGDPLAPPAEIHGTGPIGPGLLAQLMCDAAVRTVTTDGHSDGPTPQTTVLDVGRSRRLATPRQRVAVLHRQGGRCATPGCGATHLEVHHVQWWERDAGRTDLANLVGLCSRCHAHVHLGRLEITPDRRGGWTISRSGPLPLVDHERRQRHEVRRRLRALRRAVRQAAPDRPGEPAALRETRRSTRPADARRVSVRPPRGPVGRRPAAPLRT